MSLQEYLENNNIAAEETNSGLKYVKSVSTDGAKAQKKNMVSVHYTGKLLDGSVFDSSVQRGTPLDFTLGVGQVIAGWDEGIALLNKGEKATLYIPSDLAYGARGAGGVIPPHADLIFEVELVDFK
ncbi:MAG: FKBP-type peptidyl-prolyl cis-trans isomerase [Cyclobacteriaceae bacterium]